MLGYPNVREKRILKKSGKVRFVEIELESPEEVKGFLELYDDLKKYLREGDGIVVMLDNFTPREVKKIIRPLAEAGIFVELSGGINERNILRYNIAGVSAVSSGAITTKAPNLDFSLQVMDK